MNGSKVGDLVILGLPIKNMKNGINQSINIYFKIKIFYVK